MHGGAPSKGLDLQDRHIFQIMEINHQNDVVAGVFSREQAVCHHLRKHNHQENKSRRFSYLSPHDAQCKWQSDTDDEVTA